MSEGALLVNHFSDPIECTHRTVQGALQTQDLKISKTLARRALHCLGSARNSREFQSHGSAEVHHAAAPFQRVHHLNDSPTMNR
jgi:hypothetical protein